MTGGKTAHDALAAVTVGRGLEVEIFGSGSGLEHRLGLLLDALTVGGSILLLPGATVVAVIIAILTGKAVIVAVATAIVVAILTVKAVVAAVVATVIIAIGAVVRALIVLAVVSGVQIVHLVLILGEFLEEVLHVLSLPFLICFFYML